MGQPVPDLHWDKLSLFRREVPKEILKLPVVYSTLLEELVKHIPSDVRVLDVGANDRILGRTLTHGGFRGTYRSMDISPETQQDYYSLEDIHETFEVIVLKEVIEHLPLAQFLTYLRKVSSLLVPGGKLLLTTPNVYSVVHWESWDITHIQHYPYQDLYALLRMEGFQVKLTRIAEKVFYVSPGLPLRVLKHVYRQWHVRSFPQTDFAGSLFVEAVKG